MLVICYGIPKSGSTLAYEVIRGILISAGYPQEAFHNDRLDGREDARQPRGLKRAYVASIDRGKIESLIARVEPGRIIAVKTHSGFTPDLFPWLEAMQEQRKIQVIASYRDPRDICLSLVDAGERSRHRGTGSFAGVEDLETAARNVERRIKEFGEWASLKGSLRLYYNDVAFETDKAIDAIERTLSVKSDRSAVMRYAFEEANTLKNKVAHHRYKEELDDDEKTILRQTFRGFIRKVIEQNDQQYFDRRREKILALAAEDGEAG